MLQRIIKKYSVIPEWLSIWKTTELIKNCRMFAVSRHFTNLSVKMLILLLKWINWGIKILMCPQLEEMLHSVSCWVTNEADVVPNTIYFIMLKVLDVTSRKFICSQKNFKNSFVTVIRQRKKSGKQHPSPEPQII